MFDDDCLNNFKTFHVLWQVIEAGANALVAGSAVFGAKDYAQGKDSLTIFVIFIRENSNNDFTYSWYCYA